jgi:hypothetical protein
LVDIVVSLASSAFAEVSVVFAEVSAALAEVSAVFAEASFPVIVANMAFAELLDTSEETGKNFPFASKPPAS